MPFATGYLTFDGFPDERINYRLHEHDVSVSRLAYFMSKIKTTSCRTSIETDFVDEIWKRSAFERFTSDASFSSALTNISEN